MTTSLGHGIGNALIWHGRNDHATTTIFKGEVLQIDRTVIVLAEGLNNDPVFSIQPMNVTDSSSGQAGIAAGIANDDIPPGDMGEFTVLGLVKAKYDDTIAVGLVVGVDASVNTRVSAATNTTFQSPCGIALEVGVVGALKWTFIDFISASFGGGVAAAPNVRFWGVTY